MSLVELIAQADERGLAASGLACLDRCAPLLGGGDEVFRPLWTSLADGAEWDAPLAAARAAIGPVDAAADEATALAHRMLVAAPASRAAGGLREWADGCSVAALQIHRLLDTVALAATNAPAPAAVGGYEPTSPLVAAELRRQIRTLELLANQGAGAGGLRQAHTVATEGRRVLRAVVSRRARSAK
ncbi:hypothetical protein [Streptomyces sp. NPDC059009]|uniref:hypothetical protein n=1 Tax=Streptomyces sp. NPDC059009 TaxID=3346694 RepID=UPI0036996887